MAVKKVYVPPRVLNVLETRCRGMTLVEANNVLYHAFPEISKRSIRRYTRAFFDDVYTTQLVAPHYTNENFSYRSVVPTEVDSRDWNTWVRRLKALQKRGEHIRFVNLQDVHLETADPALIQMCLTIAADFDPHLFPVMCDVVDNVLLARRRHPSSYFNYQVTMKQPFSAATSDISGVEFFIDATMHYVQAVKRAVPNAQLFVLLGNHEAWALDLINQVPEVGTVVLKTLFRRLRRFEVLWPKSATQRELPITDSVIAVHGWSTRSSQYGSNANAYLRYYEGVSVIAGHAHRMEVAWSRPDFSTGGRRFAAVTGTLGTTRPAYAQQAYLGHTMGFQLIRLSPSGHVGHVVENVEVFYRDGFYTAFANGKQYVEKSTVALPINPFVTN